MKKNVIIFMLVLLITSGFGPAWAAPPAPWQSKVDNWLLNQLDQAAANGTSQVEFLVFLSEQADLSGVAALKTKQEKGAYVFNKLTETARRTQPAVTADLEKRGVEYRAYWVANMVWVKGDENVLQAMAERTDVAHVYANPQVKMQLPETQAVQSVNTAETIQWNIRKVNADKVWAAGYNGQGAVVAGADTGYDWQHPALKDQYRGWNGASADHNYNWHDAIHCGDDSCPEDSDSPEPIDPNSHGTHTMGIMVGDDGAGNKIGVAPGAKWIGCRNMDSSGVGSPARYSECFEWFIAPYAIGAASDSGDPAKAPDVVNNSWDCPFSEGCTDPNVLLPVVNAVKAAGILVVASAGNLEVGSPQCSSIQNPIAIYPSSFTVGATDSSDVIAYFSLWGPVANGLLKPEISAPGVKVYSSIPGTTEYGYKSGTSMAAPHVVGLAALLISADPNLRGQVDSLVTNIEHNALPITTTQTCGSDLAGAVPNNVYGWGRVDAWASYLALPHYLHVDKAVPATSVAPGQVFTYTLTLIHQDPLTITHNVILTDVIPLETSLITATTPFTFDEGLVRWDFPSLGLKETRLVNLTIQVPVTATGSLVNRVFVSSAEVPVITGTPVITLVRRHSYFPILMK